MRIEEQRFMKLVRLALAFAVIFVCNFIQAQTAPDLENGFKSYGSYDSSTIDTVDLKSGNLMVHIPMPWTYPQRGSDISAKNLLTMSSKTWQTKCVNPDGSGNHCFWTSGIWNPQQVALRGSGLGFDHTMDVSLHRTWSYQSDIQENLTYFSGGYTVTTPDGGSHDLSFPTPGAPLDSNGDATAYDATDGSGFHVNLSNPDPTDGTPATAILTDRHGNRYQGAWGTQPNCRAVFDNHFDGNSSSRSCQQATLLSSITDVNGNVFTNTTDTMGRPFHTYTLAGASDPTLCVMNGLTFGSSSIVTYAGPNGATNQAKLCYGTVNIATAFGLANVAEAQSALATNNGSPATMPVLVTLILPDSNNQLSSSSPKWVFSYDSYINLISMGLPSGGSISYTWQTLTVGLPCDKISRVVASRTLNDNNGHSYTWTYHWGAPASGASALLTNRVSDPLQNDTVHVFADVTGHGTCPGYETQTQQFQGSSASGTLLKQVDTTYLPAGFSAVPISIKTTLFPSNKVNLVSKQYDSGPGPNQPIFGNVITEIEYDWGQGAPGALLRETDTTYQWQVDNRYVAARLLDLPASVIIKNGSGNRMAETDYTYDEAAYLTGYEATVGALPTGTHIAAPNAVRGNPTSVSKWLNTTNSSIVSHSNWYDTGELHQAIDPLGHTTTHSYDSSYAGAYSTQTCSPATSGTTHCVSGAYDFNTGALSSLTDENGQTGNFSYDSMGRLILAQSAPDPGNGGARAQTSLTFSPANTFPLSVQRTKSITASLSDSATNFFDGLGRANKGQHGLPNGTATVDTIYDALGRPTSASNPYFTTTDSTYGITQTLYDALGRAYQTVKQDGSSSSVNYTAGNCTLTTDEAGSQRKTCSDALGRLVEVDEPGVVTGQATNNYVTLQTDGNFVLYDPNHLPLWSTGTSGTNAGPVEVQDDGNLVLYQFRWQGGTYRVPTGATFSYDSCRVSDSLFVGQTLTEGQCLESMSGMTFALMSHSDIQIYDRQLGQVTFDAGTYGQLGGYAVMQSDGRLAIYSPSNVLLWASTTAGTGAANVATLENDGRLIVYSTAWNLGTSQGQTSGSIAHPACDIGFGVGTTGAMGVGSCAVSRNGRYELLMQSDGNLVLYNRSVTPMQALWSTNTGLTPLSPTVAMRTLYSYDTLGNLTCVEQHGDAPTGTGCSAAPTSDATSPWRIRRFTYDSLSRLLTAKNPESGMISYTYDADGELLQKTSPAPNQTGSATQTVSFCYDALHRVIGKGYGAQSCPLTSAVVSYTYDSGANAKGKLISLTDQAGTASYTYDTLGRLSAETRSIAGVSKTTGYSYNLDGSVKTLTYPSNRVVTYTPDSAGRLVSASDANGTNYVISASYNPDGSLKNLLNGSTPALNQSFQYTPRLQLCRITSLTSGTLPTSCTDTQNIGNIMDRGYDFHAGNGTAGSGSDNGNVFGITNYRDANRSQAFTYDILNRLTSGWSSASTGTYSWGENYSIDAWGNLQISPMGSKAHGGNFTLSGNAQNRPTGLAYDAAGNLMSYVSATYTYDQENRLSSTAGMSYTYDGNGERVLKSNASTGAPTKFYWSMGGNTLAEGDGTGNLTAEYIYFGGKRIARIDLPSNTVHYYLSDHLGSTSLVASAAGTVEEESDYYPFGTEVTVTGPGVNELKFTGKRRDTESQLDYFGARYYSNLFGRFHTPDVPFADQHRENPQSWNLYASSLGNPLKFVDPTGRCNAPAVGPGQVGICVDTWIKRDWINGIGRGDGKNRVPVANDSNSSFRSEEKWVADYNTHKIVGHESYASRSGVFVHNFGPRGTVDSSAENQHTDADGYFYFRDHLVGQNGFGEAMSGLGPIQHDIVFKISPNGSVDIDAAQRKAFPSLEIWSYDEKGNSSLMWYIPERNPSDLNGREDQYFHGRQSSPDKWDDSCHGASGCHTMPWTHHEL
jgi:RHS repeat-associated protein